MTDDSEPTDDQLSHTYVTGAILCLIALTIGLRLYHADRQSLTFDEYYEVELAKHRVGHIIRRGDGFPPLYALTLHAWNKAFGSESGRYLSISMAAFGCVAIYRLANAFAGERAGLWSALLLATLPIHMVYSAEIRAYALLMLLGTLALEAFLYAIRRDQWWHWGAYSLLTTLGLYTHYLFGLFPAMTLAISLVYVRSIKPFVAGTVILGLSVPVVIFCLPADMAMQGSYTFQRPFGLAELAFTYGSYLTGFTLGPSLSALRSLTPSEALAAIMPWAIAFCASLTAMFGCAFRDLPWRNRELPIFVALAFAPLATGLATEQLGIGYNVRYSIWAIVPILVLLGVVASKAWQSRLGKSAIALLLALFAVALVNRHRIDDYRNEDLAAVSAYLSTSLDAEPSNVQPDNKRPILVVSGYMAEPLRHYVGASRAIYAIPMTSPHKDRFEEMKQLLDRLATQTDTFWLVYTREFHEDPDGRLLKLIEKTATVELIDRFAGVRLYGCRIRAASEQVDHAS